MNELLTDRLRLWPFDLPAYEAAIAGEEALAAHLGAPVATRWIEYPEALPYWLHHLRDRPELRPWALYGYFDRSTGELIGGGGFKGSPSADGMVEIGYGLAPSHRGRGLATEAALELVRFAFTQPDVRAVVAHTLPADNESTRVLRRAGFSWAADVVDPDDGPVWQWRITR